MIKLSDVGDIHKMSSKELRRFRDWNEDMDAPEENDHIDIEVIWRAGHELRVREDTALDLYCALVLAVDHLDGEVRLTALKAIAKVEDCKFIDPLSEPDN